MILAQRGGARVIGDHWTTFTFPGASGVACFLKLRTQNLHLNAAAPPFTLYSFRYHGHNPSCLKCRRVTALRTSKSPNSRFFVGVFGLYLPRRVQHAAMRLRCQSTAEQLIPHVRVVAGESAVCCTPLARYGVNAFVDDTGNRRDNFASDISALRLIGVPRNPVEATL